MPIYTMEVVTQVLTIVADNEEQAEAKYDAYFAWDESCPCGVVDCDCVDDSEDVYHITKEETPESCGACGQFFDGWRKDHWLECDENPENISNDDNANPANHFVAPKENKQMNNKELASAIIKALEDKNTVDLYGIALELLKNEENN